MTELRGDLLPFAVAVALSPFPIVAIVLVLSTRRATANGLAFLVGWLAGLAALTGFAVATTGWADPESKGPAIVDWLRIAAGVALIVLAARKWFGRPKPGAEPEPPAWMASIDSIQPTRAVALGAALGGLNPKNIALVLAAGSVIGQSDLTGSDAALTAVAFVALASSSVVGAVVAHLVAAERSAAALGRVKDFMLRNNAVIMMVLLLVFGAMLIGDGIAGL